MYAALKSKKAAQRNLAQGVLLSYSTILILLAIGEGYFRYVHAESGWEPTLAHRNWHDKYWHLNSQGFRDQEWQSEDWQDKTVITVLGDSFASGWGVKDPADRFPDVLADHLGDDYYVMNLAQPGTSTPQQLAHLQEHQPPQPHIVLLQYFLNDIEFASVKVSRTWESDNFATPPPRLIEESYLLNFVYWQVYPQLQTVDMTFEGSYWHWQYSSYDNEVVREFHWRELDEFIMYVESIGAELYIVIFPNMRDPMGSIAYVDRVKFQFEDAGYADNILTLYDEVAAWDVNEAVVSARDAHPSAKFHRRVGDLVYEVFFQADE